tara:strand:- start:237223 stop:238080 length:858 start_codon:yes stop_codon:yes gene_type:complete
MSISHQFKPAPKRRKFSIHRFAREFDTFPVIKTNNGELLLINLNPIRVLCENPEQFIGDTNVEIDKSITLPAGQLYSVVPLSEMVTDDDLVELIQVDYWLSDVSNLYTLYDLAFRNIHFNDHGEKLIELQHVFLGHLDMNGHLNIDLENVDDVTDSYRYFLRKYNDSILDNTWQEFMLMGDPKVFPKSQKIHKEMTKSFKLKVDGGDLSKPDQKVKFTDLCRKVLYVPYLERLVFIQHLGKVVIISNGKVCEVGCISEDVSGNVDHIRFISNVIYRESDALKDIL